jgi:choline kinase
MEERKRVIILCAGESTRWNKYLGVDKHFINIDGESLLDRTVRLVKENEPSADIFIVANDEKYQREGTTLYKPTLNPENLEADNWLSSKELWLKDGKTYLIFGDIWFSEEAIKKILADKVETWRVYGREGGSTITGKVWEEWFCLSFQKNENELIEKALGDLTELRKKDDKRKSAGWQFYRLLKATDEKNHFVTINDFTEDFDFPHDYDNWLYRRNASQIPIEERKIVIAIPSGRGEVALDFLTAIIEMVFFTKNKYPKINISFVTCKQTYIHVARNSLVENFLSMNADMLMCIDDDNVPQPDHLARLLELKLPIASGLYFKRRPPFEPIIMLNRVNGEGTERRPDLWREGGDNSPFKVHSTGFGFILIERRVFLDIKKMGLPMFEARGGVGEDIWFCIQAKAAGYDTIVDPSVEVGHLGERKLITGKDYRDYYAENIQTRIEKAKIIQGWLSDKEIEYLANEAVNVEFAAEVGSWKGKSTQVLSLAKKLWCIDRFDGVLEGQALETKEITGTEIIDSFKDNIKDFDNISILHGDSVEMSKKFNDRVLDFVFIDGGHDYEQCSADLKAYWEKTKIGGHVVVHDYVANWAGVVKAVDEFMQEHSPIAAGRLVPNTTIYEIIKL